MKQLVFIAIFLSILFLPAAKGQEAMPDSLQLRNGKNVAASQVGIASYYSDKFEGRKTATGRIFTQKKLTAASNRFPLNCWVKVTNLSNKKSVIVHIIDRMHPRNPRLIDLSRLAAGKLGYIGKGLTKVRVEYLGRKKPADAD
jgi:rare lipoprotein A